MTRWPSSMPPPGAHRSHRPALGQAGHRAAPYHAGLSKARRSATLDDFLRDRVDLIVATCAFGMGIDKPNVRLECGDPGSSSNAGGLLPGGRPRRARRGIRPLCIALASGRHRVSPEAVEVTSRPEGYCNGFGRTSNGRGGGAGQRAGSCGAAAPGMKSGAGSGRLASGDGAAPPG